MNVKNKDILSIHGNSLTRFCKERFGFKREPNIIFVSDEDNYHKLFGKSAYFDPQNENIVVYVTGRHPKDILRSLAHELVHHAQNSRGDLFSQETLGPGYAQNNSHMREMEREAYEEGNLAFRDYEDNLKLKKKGDRIMIERNLAKAIQTLIESKLSKKEVNTAGEPRGGQPGAPEPVVEEGCIDEMCDDPTHDHGQEGVQTLAAKAMSAVAALAKAARDGESDSEPMAPQDAIVIGEDELEESVIRTPEQEKSFHDRLFGTRLVALNAKLMSNFIKK